MAKEKIRKKDSAKMKKFPSPSQPVAEKNLLAEYEDFQKEKKLLFRILERIKQQVNISPGNGIIRVFVFFVEEPLLQKLHDAKVIKSFSFLCLAQKTGRDMILKVVGDLPGAQDGDMWYDMAVGGQESSANGKYFQVEVFNELDFPEVCEKEMQKWDKIEAERFEKEGAYRFKIDYRKKNKFSVFKNGKEVGSFELSGYNSQILQVLAKAKKSLTYREICERAKTPKFKTGKGLEGEKVKGCVKDELIPSFSTYIHRINKKLEKFSLKIDSKEFRYSIITLN